MHRSNIHSKPSSIYCYIKRIIFILFVFSIPYEYFDPFNIAHVISLPRIIALVFLTVSVFDRNIMMCSKRSFIDLLLLLLCFSFLFLRSVFSGFSLSPLMTAKLVSLVQYVVLYYIIINYLVNNKDVFDKALNAFIIAVVLLSLYSLVNQSILVDTDGRLIIFGSNSNTMGNYGAYSLLFSLHYFFNKKRFFYKVMYVFFFLSSLYLVVLSGSRGALIVSFLGVSCYLILQIFSSNQYGVILKLLLVLILLLSLIFLTVHLVLTNETMLYRFTATLEDGNIAGRDILWRYALSLIQDNIVFGNGLTGYEYKVVGLKGYYMDTHNIFLFLLVTGGIVALLFWLCFIVRCLYRVIKVYIRHKDSLLLILFVMLFFLMNKTGGILFDKFLWFMLALIQARSFTFLQFKE